MARRADPHRIFTARRSAVRNILTDAGMATETAEAWVDAWQDEADRQGLGQRLGIVEPATVEEMTPMLPF